MARKKYSPEQVIRMLREAEVELAQGVAVDAVCKKLGITKNTYYRWRKEYGGLKVDQAKRLKELEQENARRSVSTEMRHLETGFTEQQPPSRGCAQVG